MVEHREGRFCPEDCINPGDAKYARSNHRAERRIQRMPAAAQNARRYFIQIAQRLKEQHAQNPHACALNDRSIRRKKPRERISEQDNRKKRNRTAKQRQAQTQPQNAPTSPEFPGGVVLTGKGRRRLTERGNDVIGNVFKIHGYRASGNCICAEAVNRRLHKNVCKAEHRNLHSRRNAGFQNAPHAITRAPLTEECKPEHCIRSLQQPYYCPIGLAMKRAGHLTPAMQKFVEYLPYREQAQTATKTDK